jgi:phosphoglycolate phosphatase
LFSEHVSGASIVFDLDGTLVDTAPDLVRALNEVVEPEGLEPVPVADVRAMVGRGARVLIERAYAAQGRHLQSDDVDAHVRRFIEVYRGGIADRSQPFVGCIEALDGLKAAGARLSVCTNKPSELADLLLRELDMERYFDRIVGPERAPAKKPDAAHLFASVDTGAKRIVLVGDSEPDATCAKAAGIPCILMAHGYSEIPVGTLGADRLLESFLELPDALEAVLTLRP